MLTYPNINPIAFSLGPLKVHWYGLMYLIGFVGAWLLGYWRIKHYKLNWNNDQLSDLIFYSALGVILGGRVGYMLFYDFQEFIHHPWVLFKIWEGGMSFHGGLLGVVIAAWLFCRKYGKTFLEVGDFVAPLVPLGLAAGRLGNFINGELWGRVTDVPWGMIYPHVDDQPRHPSQWYEFGLEGVALFILIWCYASKPRQQGRVSALFLMGYAICRLIAESFRQPDSQLGFVAFGWLTMGQVLSIPMLLIGIWLWWAKR
ncbi:TPA: prolipoprotein diacylglyceryl transferase [Legionella pneumophila]|uniref:prolipoprotein diacylglyceryl transferase n=1 Tax=Legionella pneumophila TaxID=446 RepID=UPI0001E3C1C9|nr:prolipoprotein diacylglyceryl transferase [Legionella pneumophila]MDC8029775.1 prolipoprotein diacylglyceryl transferase [Legionella pneumophila subsp. pneumophila]MDW8869155.1 prolipoprotein diacylglyceryl transferase [Legionella pneumophila]MDW8915165.1 prolipoprotein diacylglyceryl transferase [Legionella pneumophila]MDW8924533.1 prolipoprotein diacylglyceryl transferase [Legionella pneumophila]MDW8930705.1 prolipoprotein diacylglyceryl transferase [Legionella pneumophila]